jgi:hypothetical protein
VFLIYQPAGDQDGRAQRNRAVTENFLPVLFEEAYRLPDFEGELVTF